MGMAAQAARPEVPQREHRAGVRQETPVRVRGVRAADPADNAPMHDLNPDQLLATTRAVHKRLDLERPVSRELLLECLELAVQAPSGSNRQARRFLFLTQREPKRVVAEYYRLVYDAPGSPWPEYPVGDVRRQRQPKLIESSDYLGDHRMRCRRFCSHCVRVACRRTPEP